MTDAFPDAAMFDLMRSTGFVDPTSVSMLQGGRNNRVLSAVFDDKTVVIKQYFSHAEDPRDRLTSEYAFITYAWKSGVRCIPEPLGKDEQNGIALYAHVPGDALADDAVCESDLCEALDFFEAINASRNEHGGPLLPRASEACFSLGDHIQCVSERLNRLESVTIETTADQKLRDFRDKELKPTWHRLTEIIRKQARRDTTSLDAETPMSGRRISPSDFGFHNALRKADGTLCFLDFEYAGWDDPAKMVADFFCQPAVPVPLHYFDMFAERVSADLDAVDRDGLRMRLLLPVYQVKWVCILLNEFLPIDANRRRFAANVGDLEQRKMAQLTKAKQAASRLAIRKEQIIVFSDQGKVIIG